MALQLECIVLDVNVLNELNHEFFDKEIKMRFRKTSAFFIFMQVRKTSLGSSKINSVENLTFSITTICENCLMAHFIFNFFSRLK